LLIAVGVEYTRVLRTVLASIKSPTIDYLIYHPTSWQVVQWSKSSKRASEVGMGGYEL